MWKESDKHRICFDNGAYQIKYGLATDEDPEMMFNCTGKEKTTRTVYVGNEIIEKLEKGQNTIILNFPLARGLLHDSDAETIVWKQCMSQMKKRKKNKMTEESESCFCLATPPVVPDIVMERYGEMIFEDFSFGAFFKTTSANMAYQQALNEIEDTISEDTALILDSSFSFTYATPILANTPVIYSSTRLDVGGKLLTNLLNEQVSYKEYNLTGETMLVNNIKESLCYVSNDFESELNDSAHNPQSSIPREYVLPDYNETFSGYVRTEENAQPNDQTIRMTNQRFVVPETLFNPSDIGIHQAGIPEMISQSIAKCPTPLQSGLYNNILLTGGNSMFEGFSDRIESELNRFHPENFSQKPV